MPDRAPPPAPANLSRRRAVLAGVAGLAALGLPPAASAKPLVAEDDKRLAVRRMTVPGATGPLAAYYVRPAAQRPKPQAVLLVHESRGLVDYVQDVARRLAVAGYAVLAPDFLSPVGGTPADSDQAKGRNDALVTDQAVANAVAGAVWLAGRDDLGGKVAAVGFAWGGTVVGKLAAVMPALTGGVIFYGKPPTAKEAAAIRVPLLVHVAEQETRNDEEEGAFEQAMKAAGAPLEAYRYADAGASFHNDTSPKRFKAEAAQLAWDRTLTFLKARQA